MMNRAPLRILVALAFGASAAVAQPNPARDAAAAGESAPLRLGALVGAPVQDPTGREIGRVEDAMLDPRSDRVVRILLGGGSWLRVGDPGVELAPDRVVASRAAVRQVLPEPDSFGAQPRPASEVLEARVEDWDGLDVGEVADVVISSDGRIRHLLVQIDEGLLEPTRVAAVAMPPWREERPGSNDLVLTVDRREVDAAPRGPEVP